ncbi:hypothetical protein DFH28DRAFT_927803 [Melampsora americana]|nr:hypothetical protein DFH28DRAFT_927803 [Melampsora americana]
MAVFKYYWRSSSPDTKSMAIEVAKQIVARFETCTDGDATLIYPDGQTFNVHLFNNLTYRIVNAGTIEAKCIFNCLELDSDQENDEGQYRLQYYKVENSGIKTPCTVNVLFLDKKVLEKDDIQRILT